MFDLFVNSFANPANMALGGLLISSPILIHLINRMRYKRLRWAAMEFLLKSQKRNRRRLIIEQLILLLLRILLVLLAGLLLARFLGASGFGVGSHNTVHLILLDDRLSMNDQWKDKNGEKKTAFAAGKEKVEKIAKEAMSNRSTQYIVLRRLSEPTTDLFNRRLNDDTMRELKATLDSMEECTKLHLDMTRGIVAARELFGKHAPDERYLYIVSDFRQRHWSEPEVANVRRELEGLNNMNVKVVSVDVADPKRPDGSQAPLCHDNLAIVELRPETRVAAKNVLVNFRVAVANYGTAERQGVRVAIKVNGTEDFGASQVLASVPPGRPAEATFPLTFNNTGFNQITAHLENEDYGLAADNIRFAVIEVRPQVGVLVIDGEGSNGDRPGGDAFHLRTLFNAAKGFEVVRGVPSDLEAPNLLQKYASIYLLNVRELNDKQTDNLKDYVREGGGVAFFLGDRITNVDFYNKKLYADGAGIFPAPLADQPTKSLTEEEKQERLLQSLREPQMQVFVRDPKHPILEEAAKYKAAFQFLSIERYHPVPRQRWKFDPERVQELLTLPNSRPLANYIGTVQDLLKELPIDDPRYAAFKPGLQLHRTAINAALRGTSLNPLALALEGLLHDRGQAGDPERPSMEEFWQQPDAEIGKLRRRVETLHDDIQLGDPLMIAGQYGKGRVIAVMTTAGRKWNDWAAGGPASFTFPVIMIETQKYLSSVGAEEANLTVGTHKFFELEASRYEPSMSCYYQGEAKDVAPLELIEGVNEDAVKKAGLEDHQQLAGEDVNGRLKFDFARARKPGIYHFLIVPRSAEEGQPRIEPRAYAFNVDTANESDLRRVASTELDRISKVAAADASIVAPDRKTDWSESPWLYLLFLVILIIEQALAVHLSFHLRGNEAALPPAAAVRTSVA
jgi:hypothetical protein